MQDSAAAPGGGLYRWLGMFFSALPLVGVLVLGLDARGVVSYYWSSNAAIAVTQPIFILVAAARNGRDGTWYYPEESGGEAVVRDGSGRVRRMRVGGMAGAMFFAGFFFFHFGIFTTTHLVFLAVLGLIDPAVVPLSVLVHVLRRVILDGRDEVETSRTSPFPGHLYAGVVVLHLAIIFGGWAAVAVGAGGRVAAAVVLCGLGVLGELVGGGIRSRRLRS